MSEYPTPPRGLRQEQATARMKSYATAAVLVMVLYLFLWLPGLVANYVYLQEARRMEEIAGEPLPGTGCLHIMLFVGVISFLLAGLVAGLLFSAVVLEEIMRPYLY